MEIGFKFRGVDVRDICQSDRWNVPDGRWAVGGGRGGVEMGDEAGADYGGLKEG